MKKTHTMQMPNYDGTGLEDVEGDIRDLIKEAYTRGIHNGVRQERDQNWMSWVPNYPSDITQIPPSTLEAFAAIAVELAQDVIWANASGCIRTKFQSGEDGYEHIGAATVKTAQAILAMCPDSFLHKGLVYVVEGTNPDLADFLKKYPFHMAAIMMRYPRITPKIVVPEDPFEKKEELQ